MKNAYQIVYLARTYYPKPAAHALQSIQMAAAFSRLTSDAHLFVRDLIEPETEVRKQYGLEETPLQLWSLRNQHLPGPLQGYYGHSGVFNSLVTGILLFHPFWRNVKNRRRILYNRMRQEAVFWGQMKPRFPWMKNWVFVHEAHDVAGLDPRASLEENPFKRNDGQRQMLLNALLNYDLIVCVTQALAEDLHVWSQGRLSPRVVRHASSLPRLDHSPVVRPKDGQIMLGYMGTVDTYRGVDKLILAMRFLPANYHLRIVGRIAERSEAGRDPVWLSELLSDPLIGPRVEMLPPVPVQQVAEEIDRCDILLQPASSDILTLRYASPLKSFDYMVRGKPIVAADVPCHRELFRDGFNASLYRLDDVLDLSNQIQSLAQRPGFMEQIACNAWAQSVDYTYDGRARRILELVDEITEQKSTHSTARTSNKREIL